MYCFDIKTFRVKINPALTVNKRLGFIHNGIKILKNGQQIVYMFCTESDHTVVSQCAPNHVTIMASLLKCSYV